MGNVPRIVPDTNVLISGTTISTSAPSQVLYAWRVNRIEVATSEAILEELKRVLSYPRVYKIVGMDEEAIDLYIKNLQKSAILVAGRTQVDVSSDPDDNKFFSCAVEAQANYIVSMDKKHILSVEEYKGIKTVHPTDFVRDILKLEKAV